MPKDRTAYTSLIQQVADTYQLPFNLLEAQVLVESGGDPWACRYEAGFFHDYIKDNPKAQGYALGPLAAMSLGLMQVLVQVAMEHGFDDRPERLFVPRVGLAYGAMIMKENVAWALGDYDRALCAYNGGRTHNTKKPFANAAYADKVYAQVRSWCG